MSAAKTPSSQGGQFRPPSVDAVLRSPELSVLREQVERPFLVEVVREVVARAHSAAEILPEINRRFEHVMAPQRPVINATGAILHTNLGRAPLSDAAREAMLAASGYTNLEFDLEAGRRGGRLDQAESLVNLLIGSEASVIVTNNAAGLVLSLRALATKRKVIVSRGQLVEIGNGFRIPEIMRESGARMVEVGTTNRTTLADYEGAADGQTAAFLHVHLSNFVQSGFVAAPSIKDLARSARDRKVLMIADNGSGPLIDTREFGLAHEPTPAEAMEAGADVVTFSADKLLGGPQAGIVAGRKGLIDTIRKCPLARALRPDKLVAAALTATLQQYLRGESRQIPVVTMLSAEPDQLRRRAEDLAARLAPVGVEALV